MQWYCIAFFLEILNNTLIRIKKMDCFLFGDFNYNILDCEKLQILDFIHQMFGYGFAPQSIILQEFPR